jgi:hypothetical protein
MSSNLFRRRTLSDDLPTSAIHRDKSQAEVFVLSFGSCSSLPKGTDSNEVISVNSTQSEMMAMLDVMYRSRELQGKETDKIHFINEHRLIAYAVTGFSKKIDRGKLTHLERFVLMRIYKFNRRLLQLHVDYATRKKRCRVYAKKLYAHFENQKAAQQ